MEIYYNVFAIRRDGRKEWVATYQDAMDAHEAAKRYDAPYTIIQIEKTSKPFSLKTMPTFVT